MNRNIFSLKMYHYKATLRKTGWFKNVTYKHSCSWLVQQRFLYYETRMRTILVSLRCSSEQFKLLWNYWKISWIFNLGIKEENISSCVQRFTWLLPQQEIEILVMVSYRQTLTFGNRIKNNTIQTIHNNMANKVQTFNKIQKDLKNYCLPTGQVNYL